MGTQVSMNLEEIGRCCCGFRRMNAGGLRKICS